VLSLRRWLLYELENLARLRVPPERLLRKHPAPVDLDFEHAARGLDELHLRLGVGLANLSRQTGGSRFVVSDYAVLDGDPHIGKG